MLRGAHFYFQFTEQAHARAREIWQEGLTKFPNSNRLRSHLAASYRHAVEAGWSKNPGQDLARAWQLGRQATRGPHKSRYDEWHSHWLMAKLAQWYKEDFELSVTEALAAVELVPYDATSRADLAELMANAGRTGDAIAWLHEAMRRDPTGPEWYSANLAWAYYLDARYEDAESELRKLKKPRHLLLAAVHIKLGKYEDARATVAAFLESRPGYTLADEMRRPLIGSLKQGWLDDLREAGLPDGPSQ